MHKKMDLDLEFFLHALNLPLKMLKVLVMQCNFSAKTPIYHIQELLQDNGFIICHVVPVQLVGFDNSKAW